MVGKSIRSMFRCILVIGLAGCGGDARTSRASASALTSGAPTSNASLCQGTPSGIVPVPITGNPTTIRDGLVSDQVLGVELNYSLQDYYEACEDEVPTVQYGPTNGSTTTLVSANAPCPYAGTFSTSATFATDAKDGQCLAGYWTGEGPDGDEAASATVFSFGADSNISPLGQLKTSPSNGFYIGALGSGQTAYGDWATCTTYRPTKNPGTELPVIPKENTGYSRCLSKSQSECDFSGKAAEAAGPNNTYAYWAPTATRCPKFDLQYYCCPAYKALAGTDFGARFSDVCGAQSNALTPGWPAGSVESYPQELQPFYDLGSCQAALLFEKISNATSLKFPYGGSPSGVNSSVLFLDFEKDWSSIPTNEAAAMLQGFADEVRQVRGKALGVYTNGQANGWQAFNGIQFGSSLTPFVYWAIGLSKANTSLTGLHAYRNPKELLQGVVTKSKTSPPASEIILRFKQFLSNDSSLLGVPPSIAQFSVAGTDGQDLDVTYLDPGHFEKGEGL